MRIGGYDLEAPLSLSPLAGYTNLPMRLTLRARGGLGWAVTDLINARALLERRPRALELAATAPGDEPLAIQLFGSNPEEMREAARLAAELGAQAVDVNMGCPVRKVTGIGGGAAMMTELRRTQALVRGMVEAAGVPVTAKMRLGWDADNLTAPDLARALADIGVSAICVHGRTRAQGFSGAVSLPGIRAVVEAVPGLPVLGNGDVTTPQAALRMMRETGCAGVAIGRGAFYDPWIFARTARLLHEGAAPPEPGFAERIAVMREHYERYLRFYGEERGSVLFRRVAPWYARRFGPSRPFRREVSSIRSRGDFEACLARYLQWREAFCGPDGELLPSYRPADLEAEEAAAADAPMPVPRGPVEHW